MNPATTRFASLVIQNLAGKHATQEYGAGGGPRGAAAYDILESDKGRIIGLTLVKNW